MARRLSIRSCQLKFKHVLALGANFVKRKIKIIQVSTQISTDTENFSTLIFDT